MCRISGTFLRALVAALLDDADSELSERLLYLLPSGSGVDAGTQEMNANLQLKG